MESPDWPPAPVGFLCDPGWSAGVVTVEVEHTLAGAPKRLDRLLGKIGKETASAIRGIVVDIASEAAKKMLMPGK